MTGTPDKIERARGPVRKFNPGTLQSDGEVIEQFVVRKPELQSVLDVLRGNIDSPSCQHVLIVAPRGRGKTMLLARAAAELRTNDAFSEFLLPVRFMEESLEIFNLADFWLEALFHLAGEIADTHPGFARELRDTHSSLSSRWREQGLHDHARAAVLEATDRLGRKLVLMLENLHSLSRNVHEDFGWQLRAVLQSEPQVMLVASAATRFEALDDVTEPYFELFRIVSLQPLDTEDCRRLWQALTGHLVPERRIRPLEILTGGSPRLLVIVAGFAAHRSLRRLMEELVALIDEHTEYFRGHLEALPRSERRVYVALLDLWAPSNTGEIAARARMNVRVVSIMLKRLIDRGSVIADPPGGNKRLYAAAEPLFSIYYKIRRERDEAAVVENLIRFMVAFYDHSVMFPAIDRIFSEARESSTVYAGVKRTLAGKRSVGDRYDKVAELGDFEGEIESYQEMVDFVKTSDRSDRQQSVALALSTISLRLVEVGRLDEALKACGELERRLAGLGGKDYWNAWMNWSAMCVRALGLMARQDTSAALSAFRSAYLQFSTDEGVYLYPMVRIVLILVAFGAPERDLIEILSSDRTKARAVLPLISALRQRAGETVRAPTEVLEVAADIRKSIEERISTEALAAL